MRQQASHLTSYDNDDDGGGDDVDDDNDGSFILHLPTFHLLGFCWDDHSRTQNCWDGSQQSPSQTPTIEILLTQYYFNTKMKLFH